MRELIIQYNQQQAFDLFEYTTEREVVPLLHNTYLANLPPFIDKCGLSHIWIEDMQALQYLSKILHSNNIENTSSVNIDAEAFHKERRKKKLPPMEYIAYWQMIKPVPYTTILSESLKGEDNQ